MKISRVHVGSGWSPRSLRKYGNVPTTQESHLVGTRRYDSKREARRAHELDLLHKSGEIRWWIPQVPLPLRAATPEGRQRVVRVDFMICWSDGRVTFEDAKGVATAKWQLQRDLVRAQYGIAIEAV